MTGANIRVPFGRPSLDSGDLKAVSEVLQSGWIAYGPDIERFEAALARFAGVRSSVTLNSCTSALELALIQAGIRGTVIIPSFTWVAVANAVVNAGATPRFADVDEYTFNLTTESIASGIDSGTEAVILPHYGGQPADIERIQQLCKRHGLVLIEDCAETMGGMHRGRIAGSSGIGCFSFYPTKAITSGMGGAVVSDDVAFIDGIRARATHGLRSSTPVDGTPHRPWERAAILPGRNLRLPNLLAVLGHRQLDRITQFNDSRRSIAAAYDERLRDLHPLLMLPYRDPQTHHVFQMYSVRVLNGRRDEALRNLWQAGVSANCHFDPPIHAQPWYEHRFASPNHLPVTDRLRTEILTLPIFPDMSIEQIELVTQTLRQGLIGAR
jgi:dTDP-4-amino-4,6-dideoxygalactose transaminase